MEGQRQMKSFREWRLEREGAGYPAPLSPRGRTRTAPGLGEWSGAGESSHRSGSFGGAYADEREKEAEALDGQARTALGQAEEYNAMRPSLVKPGEMDWSPEEIGAFQQRGFDLRQQARELQQQAREKRQAALPGSPAAFGADGAGESSHRSGSFGGAYGDLPEAYRSIPERADFKETSEYKPTGTGQGVYDHLLRQWTDTGYADPVYEYVNGNRDAILKQYNNESVSGSTLMGMDSRFLERLSSLEKGVYNTLYASEGPAAANQFLWELERELNARQREKEEAYWAAAAEKDPVGMSLFSVLTKPLNYFSYLQQAEKTLSGEALDPNAGYNRGSYTANAIRGAVSREIENSGKWGGIGSYGYDLAMSMGDFLYTSAITGGMEPLALAIMGTEAAADSVLAAKERGRSDERSFITGTIAGVIEAATEKLGFDALFKTGIRSLGKAGFRRFILRNAGAEAAEEGASDLLNWIVDDLYDLVTGTKESEFKELVAVYEENGLDHTKALLSALGDRGKELGLDTLGGFLSGLFLSGAKSGYNAVQFNRMGQEAFDTGSFQDYISLGLLADHDSEAYRYAEEIRAKLNGGREVTSIEMGQLTAAVYADALGVGEKWSGETREEPDEDIWDRGFAEERRGSAEELGLDEAAGQEALTDEVPGNIVENNDRIPPVTSEVSRALITEVQARGDKISPDEVLGITRDLSGQIVWLEKGHLSGRPSGLAHILDRHEKELNAAGISSHNIPNFVLTTVAKGRIIGYQGSGTGRAIYEITYKGKKYKIAVSVGSNGYIVGANLRGRGR